MKLSVRTRQGDVVRVRLEGQVSQRDVAPNQEPLGDLLGEQGYAQSVVIDMSEVASLDSSGVNWLLICQKRIRQAGGTLVLHSLSPITKNVIKVLNLQTVFRLADDEHAAIRLLEGEA
jgi:stage II sporulation protein AA (anti-sigma F factor antagonist)